MSWELYDHLDDMTPFADFFFSDLLEAKEVNMLTPLAANPSRDQREFQGILDNFQENIFSALESQKYMEYSSGDDLVYKDIEQYLENSRKAINEFRQQYRETIDEPRYEELLEEWYQNAHHLVDKAEEMFNSELPEDQSPATANTETAH